MTQPARTQHTRKSHFLGTKLRALRKRNGLTLEELSARCTQLDPQNAPSVSYLSMIESGKRIPSEDVLGLLSTIIAAVFILGQSDYKRALAYSSVEHMGLLALDLRQQRCERRIHGIGVPVSSAATCRSRCGRLGFDQVGP